MSWTVIKEDESGNAIETMTKQFVLSDAEVLYMGQFKLLKYIDPYGDTTFNALMFKDLISDLLVLKNKLPVDKEQIEQLIRLTTECSNEVHVYLKLCGD